jgi:hypothetical protein
MTTFKPILFSSPMVQALLGYRKNQTRRVIKGLDSLKEPYFQDLVLHATGRYTFASFYSEEIIEVKCPYQVGDILWVREKFRVMINCETKEFSSFEYYAGEEDFYAFLKETGKKVKWKPSLFMPKEACRLFLKVKSIKVKRLHDISTFDIKSEGVVYNGHFILGVQNNALSFLPKGKNLNANPPTEYEIFFAHWAELWCKINGLHSWSSNPFVWVIEFERIEKPNNFI